MSTSILSLVIIIVIICYNHDYYISLYILRFAITPSRHLTCCVSQGYFEILNIGPSLKIFAPLKSFHSKLSKGTDFWQKRIYINKVMTKSMSPFLP